MVARLHFSFVVFSFLLLLLLQCLIRVHCVLHLLRFVPDPFIFVELRQPTNQPTKWFHSKNIAPTLNRMSPSLPALAGLLAALASVSIVSVSGADTVSLHWRSIPGSSCVAFRETDGCSGDGPRIPSGDRSCDTEVPCHIGECPSGYCECGDGSKVHKVDCKIGSHTGFKCSDFCTSNQPKQVLEIKNGYASVLVNVANPGIEAIYADFEGSLDTTNVTALTSILAPETGRWQLESLDALGTCAAYGYACIAQNRRKRVFRLRLLAWQSLCVAFLKKV